MRQKLSINSNHVDLQLGNISVFYKQRSNLFYPVTSFSMPTILLRIPLSATSALLWTLMTYFVVGFAPDAGRLVKSLTRFQLHALRFHSQVKRQQFLSLGAEPACMHVLGCVGCGVLYLR